MSGIPFEHQCVTLRKLGRGNKKPRFELTTVPTLLQPGTVLIKVMYLSLASVNLQQRPAMKNVAANVTSDAAPSAAWPLLTRVGESVKGLGVGVVVAVSATATGSGALSDEVGVGSVVGGDLGWSEFVTRPVDELVAAPEDMPLAAMLATMEAAHNSIGACVTSGLLPLTATDRTACTRALESLIGAWVGSGRLSFDDARHARQLATAPLEAMPRLYGELAATTPRRVAWVKIAQGPATPLRAKL